MKRNSGYYIGKYLRENGLVLLCELLVVLLLGIICSILLQAQPLWLAPVMAVVAYFLAEIRFTMAYVAKNVNRDRELNGDDAEDDEEEDDAPVANKAAASDAQAEDAEEVDDPEFHAPTVRHFGTIGMDESDEDNVFAEPEEREPEEEPEAYDVISPEAAEDESVAQEAAYAEPAYEAPQASAGEVAVAPQEEQAADVADANVANGANGANGAATEQERRMYDANRIIGLE